MDFLQSQPLLLAGMLAACVKITIHDMCSHLKYCVSALCLFNYKCGRWLRNTNWGAAVWTFV
jgi:hypothetical protein